MTAKEIAKRNKKAGQLKVLQTDDGQFFVESGEGKILYNVIIGDEGNKCNCGDFAKNIKKDSNFNCKHILSVMNALPKKDVENAKFLEKLIPKLDERFLTNIKGKDFVLSFKMHTVKIKHYSPIGFSLVGSGVSRYLCRNPPSSIRYLSCCLILR